MFITFEGPEGGGKTLQIATLADFLQMEGYQVITTREPGGTFIGDQIRAVLSDLQNTAMQPRTEVLLFQASVYKERGEGVSEQADDILAAFFAMCMALRIDGALWGEFIERYQIDYEPEIDQKYGKPGFLGGARAAHRHFRR